MAKLMIHVTQADLDNGLRGSGSMNPAAMAVNRVLKGDFRAWVYGSVTIEHIGVEDTYAVQDLSQLAFDRLEAWGRKTPIKPFLFQTTVPDECLAAPDA